MTTTTATTRTSTAADKPTGRDARLESHERFVAAVTALCTRDLGRRAALRRSLGRPPEDATYQTHSAVVPHLPDKPSYALERAYYTVAALIAAQPRAARDQDKQGKRSKQADDADAAAEPAASEHGEPAEDIGQDGQSAQEAGPSERTVGNLGASLARAVRARAMELDVAEARLHLLTRQEVDGLHRQLPRFIRHLRSDLVPVDWARLLDDLARFGPYRKQVAKEWMQAFYRVVPPPDEPSTTTEPEPTTTSGVVTP